MRAVQTLFYEREFVLESYKNGNELQSGSPASAVIDSFEIFLQRDIDDLQIRCYVKSGNVELTRVDIFDRDPLGGASGKS